jgi:prophage regulatory protein
MVDKPTRLVRLPIVLQRTGLSRSTLYQKIEAGKFPEQHPLGDGGRAVGWIEGDIDRWIEEQASRPRKRRG